MFLPQHHWKCIVKLTLQAFITHATINLFLSNLKWPVHNLLWHQCVGTNTKQTIYIAFVKTDRLNSSMGYQKKAKKSITIEDMTYYGSVTFSEVSRYFVYQRCKAFLAVTAFLSWGTNSKSGQNISVFISELAWPLLLILSSHIPFTVVLIITENLELTFLYKIATKNEKC